MPAHITLEAAKHSGVKVGDVLHRIQGTDQWVSDRAKLESIKFPDEQIESLEVVLIKGGTVHLEIPDPPKPEPPKKVDDESPGE